MLESCIGHVRVPSIRSHDRLEFNMQYELITTKNIFNKNKLIQ